MVPDGKIVDSDRGGEKTLSRKGAEIDLWYPGKKHDSGGNVQALFYPDGLPMWISDVLPGNVHDLAAAREEVLAVLTQRWQVLRHITASPGKIGKIARAALVLLLFEYKSSPESH